MITISRHYPLYSRYLIREVMHEKFGLFSRSPLLFVGPVKFYAIGETYFLLSNLKVIRR